MVETERCGICRFFIEERGDLCVRFPPPQQALVRDDDWCGEFDVRPKPAKPMTKAEVMNYHPYSLDEREEPAAVEKPRTKAERLSSFGDLARRIK